MVISEIVRDVNQVVVLTDRVRKRKEEYLAAVPQLWSEKTKLFTESWKETEGEPLNIRYAKGLAKSLEGIPIVIREGELIVGSQTPSVRGSHPAMEYFQDELLKQVEAYKPTMSGTNVPCIISEAVRQDVRELAQYWQGKSVVDRIQELSEQIWGKRNAEYRESRMWHQPWNQLPSAKKADWNMLLTKGLNGIISQAREYVSNLVVSNEEDLEKFHFWQTSIIALESVIKYAHRHAELAEKLAQTERDPVRRSELEKIAEICKWVPANPARTFHEALQSLWFAFLVAGLETGAGGETPGRVDQYLYPFFANDVEEGRMSRQEAAELLGCLLVKILERESFKSLEGKQFYGGSLIINVTIGGVTPEGKDATNELSFLVLEAVRQVKGHTPHLTVRYHDGLSEDFLIKAIETNRDIGAGIPAFLNDKSAILGICQSGVPLAEARDWTPQGCVERVPPGATLLSAGPFFNMPKCLELALNNGVDPRTGKQLGLATGDARMFASYEEVYDAFKRQTAHIIDACAEIENLWVVVRSKYYCLPFFSALIGPCLEAGRDVLRGDGSWHSQYLTQIRPFGHQNVVNSLAAMKKVVFEDKTVTMSELLDTISVNFEGKEELHQKLLQAPKWGNDDDYVDEIMRDLFSYTEQEVKRHRNPWGNRYGISRQGLTFHFIFGQVVGALPDGRKAWDSLADGSLSAMRGTDMKGPTAIINSCSKVDGVGSESTLLNLKFHPGALQSQEGIKKLLALIKTHFDNLAHHIQFNIISRETLLAAKEHPEEYRDLLVRVAGFSARFIELAPEVQDEIIGRTEYSLC